MATTMQPLPYRVVYRRRETADVWTLELEPAAGDPIRPGPGQFTMLTAPGVGEVAISVSGDPFRKGPLVQTIRAVGHVTRALCEARPGTVLGVRGPFGTPWPVERAEGADLVLVAGGVGLPPLRGVIYSVLRELPRYRRVLVLYGSRTPADLVYSAELERWRRQGLAVAVTVDAADASWTGDVGVVTRLVSRAAFDPGSATAMVCGPEIMMRFAARALADRGVTSDRIFVSLERNMQCGVALCGHCQLGPLLICRDGPVFRYDRVEGLLGVSEL